MVIKITEPVHPKFGTLIRNALQARLEVIRSSQLGQILVNAIEAHPKTCFISDGNNYTSDRSGGTSDPAVPAPISDTYLEVKTQFGSFDLARSQRNMPARAHQVNIADRPTEEYVHELAHALRFMSGLSLRAPGQSRGYVAVKGFDNVEELFAVIIANIYISETAPSSPLVGCYPLLNDRPLTDKQLFDKPPYDAFIRTYQQQMPDFTAAVARIPDSTASFNPFRQGWFTGS